MLTDMGVLVGKGGYYGNVFRITPPLCFTREDAGMDAASSRCINTRPRMHMLVEFVEARYKCKSWLITLARLTAGFAMFADFFVDTMDVALSKMWCPSGILVYLQASMRSPYSRVIRYRGCLWSLGYMVNVVNPMLVKLWLEKSTVDCNQTTSQHLVVSFFLVLRK